MERYCFLSGNQLWLVWPVIPGVASHTNRNICKAVDGTEYAVIYTEMPTAKASKEFSRMQRTHPEYTCVAL